MMMYVGLLASVGFAPERKAFSVTVKGGGQPEL
jgi:hypothetical protein